MKKIAFGALALVAALGTCQAQEQKSSTQYFVGLGATVGGDNLITATYTNGDTTNLRAGAGVVITGGVDYKLQDDISLQASVSYHTDNANADNGSVKFQRFPVELLGFYHVTPQFRLGAGARYVTSAKLTSSGVASGNNVDFDSTLSPVIEGEYLLTPKLGFKVRYVKEKFNVTNTKFDVKADHFGFVGVYYF